MPQRGRHVLAAHRHQKGVESPRRLRVDPVLPEEVAEHDVSHAEADAGQIDAGDLLDEIVVTTAPADRPGNACCREQLKHDPRVIGEAPNNSEVNLDKIAQAHGIESFNTLDESLSPVAEQRSEFLTPERVLALSLIKYAQDAWQLLILDMQPTGQLCDD